IFGRKYWPETPLSEYSPKKRLDEYSARFPLPGSCHASRSLFSRKDAIEISIHCLETSAPEAIRGEGNSSCPSLEPKIRSLGPICPNIHPIYQEGQAKPGRPAKLMVNWLNVRTQMLDRGPFVRTLSQKVYG